MFQRNSAILVAVAGLLASAGFAVAESAPKSVLTLDPVAADTAPNGLLMQGFDKVGPAVLPGASPLDKPRAPCLATGPCGGTRTRRGRRARP